MKRKNSLAGMFAAAMALGGCLILFSGCATSGSKNDGTEEVTKSGLKYFDPGYEGTNRRRSQTHASPFK